MLLDPFEKKFYSPPGLVQGRDDDGGEDKIVGDKDEVLASFGIVIMNAPKRLGVIPGRLDARENNSLIGSQPRRFVDGMRIAPLELKVAFGPCHEEGEGLMHRIETGEVDVSAIHDVEGTWFGKQNVENAHIPHFPVGNVDKLGDAAPKIEQRVHLDRALGLAKSGPGEHCKAEVYGRGVQCVDRRIQVDAEVFVGIKLLGSGDENLSKVGIDASVAIFVGFGQGIAGDERSNAHVVKFRTISAQADFDISQAFAVGELGEGHAQELIEAGEILDFVFAPITGNAALK